MFVSHNFTADEQEAIQTAACDQSQPQSKWSKFPPDLLIRIAKLLSSSRNTTVSCKHQILRFRAVCKPWRSAVSYHHKYDDSPVSLNIPLPVRAPPSPFLLVPCLHPYDLAVEPKGSFYLVHSTAYILESVKNPSSSHFIVVDHLSDEPGKIYCRKPLSFSHDRSCTWDVNSPRSINLLDYRVSVVSEHCTLRYLLQVVDGLFVLPANWENFCKKTVLIWNPKLEDERDGVALVLFDDGKLAKYSFLDDNWKTIYDGKRSKCSDIVRSKDGCIVIDHKANAYDVKYDFGSRLFSQKHIANEIEGCRLRRKRLVLNADGDLYLIFQDGKFSNFLFTAYRLGNGKWKGSSCWGPLAILLVGLDFSCFTTARDFSCIAEVPSLKIEARCIIYSRQSFPLYKCRNVDREDRFFVRFGCHHKLYISEYNGKIRPLFVPGGEYDIDYGSIFYSPGKWDELTSPTPPCPPHCLMEQHAIPQVGRDSDENLEDHSLHPRDEYSASESTIPSVGNFHHDISQDKPDGKAKGKRTIDDSNPSEPSENPRSKSRKTTLSQPAGDNSEAESGLLNSIQKLLLAITRLISNPIQAWLDPPGCSLREVIRDLSSLPRVEIGSNFFFSAALLFQNKENRELYMCLEDADIKYKWLQYMHYNKSKH